MTGDRRRMRVFASLAAMWIAALIAGCQQKMADQPSFKPLEPGVAGQSIGSAREPVAGTVARGHLRTDWALFTGRSVPSPLASVMGAPETTSQSPAAVPLGARSSTPEAPLPGAPASTSPPAGTPPTAGSQAAGSQAAASQVAGGARAVIASELADYRDVVNEFPFKVTEQTVEHGRDRYMIYCVVCHDAAGTGQGKIVERGYTRPPSYHIDRLRNAPLGHFFRVITLGYGSMPSYASQIPPRDRWAIISYVRALQLSQHYPEDQVSQLPAHLRDQLVATGKQPSPPAEGKGP
jgi:mono/diheme cytochrome c family protein